MNNRGKRSGSTSKIYQQLSMDDYDYNPFAEENTATSVMKEAKKQYSFIDANRDLMTSALTNWHVLSTKEKNQPLSLLDCIQQIQSQAISARGLQEEAKHNNGLLLSACATLNKLGQDLKQVQEFFMIIPACSDKSYTAAFNENRKKFLANKDAKNALQAYNKHEKFVRNILAICSAPTNRHVI